MSVKSIEVDGKISRIERLPCVLILDGSDSMSAGNAIGLLNQGLVAFQNDLKSDETASLRVQVLVIRVGGTAEVVADWTDAIGFSAPVIRASGDTPLGAGIELGLSKLDQQINLLKANSIARKKPWVFLFSDGQPTDGQKWTAAASRLRQAQLDGRLYAFPIAVGPGAAADELKKAVPDDRAVVGIEAANFQKMFVFISQSSRSASVKADGAQQDMGLWGSIKA